MLAEVGGDAEGDGGGGVQGLGLDGPRHDPGLEVGAEADHGRHHQRRGDAETRPQRSHAPPTIPRTGGGAARRGVAVWRASPGAGVPPPPRGQRLARAWSGTSWHGPCRSPRRWLVPSREPCPCSPPCCSAELRGAAAGSASGAAPRGRGRRAITPRRGPWRPTTRHPRAHGPQRDRLARSSTWRPTRAVLAGQPAAPGRAAGDARRRAGHGRLVGGRRRADDAHRAADRRRSARAK